MAKIYKSIDQLIGHTPLLELINIEKKFNTKGKILAKLEYFNPAGSAKDRIAKVMIDDAEQEGKLKEGSTIIEPTSGNKGIGLASAFALETSGPFLPSFLRRTTVTVSPTFGRLSANSATGILPSDL